MIEIKKADDFLEWFDSLTEKEQAQVDARLEKIRNDEHFGKVRPLGNDLTELKWKNGWRVYFSRIGYKKIILISGGNKNEQKKGIKKARIFLRRYENNQDS